MVMPAQPHVETLQCTHAHVPTRTHTCPHFPPLFDAEACNTPPQSSFDKGENYLSLKRFPDIPLSDFQNPLSNFFLFFFDIR